MTDRDVLATARACAEQGMCAASLCQVFELSPTQAARLVAEAEAAHEMPEPDEDQADEPEHDAPSAPPPAGGGITPIDRDKLADLMAEDLSEAEIAKRLDVPTARVKAEIKALQRSLGV